MLRLRSRKKRQEDLIVASAERRVKKMVDQNLSAVARARADAERRLQLLVEEGADVRYRILAADVEFAIAEMRRELDRIKARLAAGLGISFE